MQKVAKEYMTTMRSPAVQARLKAGQTPLKASASSLGQADSIRQCFAARDGRLLGLLVSNNHECTAPGFVAFMLVANNDADSYTFQHVCWMCVAKVLSHHAGLF